MRPRLIRYRELAAVHSRRRIRHGVDRGQLHRAGRGVYATGPVDDDDRLRALFARLPEGVLLSHHSAARRLGFGVLPTDQVHLLVPAGMSRPEIQGVVTHEAVLGGPAPVMVGGVPCAPAARCAIDLARTVRRLDALPVLDAALRVRACEPDDLRAEVARHRGLRGIRQARELVALADGRAECRQESQLRLIIVDGRLPHPEPQIWVHDEFDSPIYRLDLGYEDRRVGLEYDGLSHLQRGQLRYDRARMNWLARHGWAMRYFTDYDLYRRPSGVVVAVRAALNL